MLSNKITEIGMSRLSDIDGRILNPLERDADCKKKLKK